MRIVFMGTPDFAAASLERLIDEGANVVGVFTQPDKPKDRGLKLTASPVKEIAMKAGIPVFQPEKMRDGTAVEMLKSLNPDLVAVVAYGRILPDDILAVPPKGTINIHGSLLPKYRGAAPIQWAVLNGDTLTGVSSMYLASELDSGDVIYTAETEIGEFETSGQLFERLRELGAELLIKTVRDIEKGCAPREPQDASSASFAPPLSKEMSPIDWHKTPREIIKHICGMSPWPVATAELEGLSFKIFGAEYTSNKTATPVGTVVSADCKKGIEVACGNGETLLITRLQAPGSKTMAATDYLRGHPMNL
ncbi:MAG: methionyl-tRNA formyltransferase [Firmicutes bacterium HGW-Firmicutes-16]|nr:MAG: methionyl-tRNA formyltransferase [Firmicutes bacterium HGW-Firmicutes-16]